MAIDQVHEQNNCAIKLLVSLNLLQHSEDRWDQVQRPEVVKMITEFDVCIHKSTTSDERHQKQSRSSHAG